MATVDRPTDAAAAPLGGPRMPLPPEPIDRRSLNLPNAITLSRLVLAVGLFALIDTGAYWLEAAVLFVVAASTDFLDGHFARKYGQVTTLGRIMDPFVDKVIVGGAFLFLIGKQTVYEPNGVIVTSGVTAWMALIVIGREMFVTSLRGVLEQHGIDFSADRIGKIKMILQCVAVTVSLLAISSVGTSPLLRLGSNVLTIQTLRDPAIWTTVAFTAYSGVAYFVRAMTALRDHKARA